jgi:hypothetical protein
MGFFFFFLSLLFCLTKKLIFTAYPSTMLTACVFVTRDTVRHPRRFLFGKFVRKPNCSWSEAFVNRGLTVFGTDMKGNTRGLIRGAILGRLSKIAKALSEQSVLRLRFKPWNARIQIRSAITPTILPFAMVGLLLVFNFSFELRQPVYASLLLLNVGTAPLVHSQSRDKKIAYKN